MPQLTLGSPIDRIPSRTGRSEYLALLRAFDESGEKNAAVDYLRDEQSALSVVSGFRMMQRKTGAYPHIRVSKRGEDVYLTNTDLED